MDYIRKLGIKRFQALSLNKQAVYLQASKKTLFKISAIPTKNCERITAQHYPNA
jgi:hypothetical protein